MDTYEGGTGYPQRVANVRLTVTQSSANPLAINFEEADPLIPVKT